MRELEFKGLSENGDWYYGILSILSRKVGHVEAGYYIANEAGMPYAYDVIPETVGQYTGCRDNFAKRIYEGDTISFYTLAGNRKTSPVYYKDGSFLVRVEKDGEACLWEVKEIKNIGNIRNEK